MEPVEIIRGNGPLILSAPHTGVFAPDEIKSRLNETGLALADTDWNVHQLYEGLVEDATYIRATFHRYVIDANRDPSGESLYPGQNTTGLCPTTDFEGKPLYKDGAEPDSEEIEQRRLSFHAPYHAAIEAEIKRVREANGVAVLYDCHSIRSQIPYLFEGKLPDFNIGTFNGASCAPEIESAAAARCSKAKDFTSTVNGRFKGGWTTRHYGRPDENIHAIQMELAQSTYMEETPPWAFDYIRSELIRPHLKDVLEAIVETARGLAR